jgi:hypothetical protein
VPEGEAAAFDFDPEEAARDDLPFFVGETEYLARGDQLIKAEEVKALRNRREIDGHTWFDVAWTDGEYTVQRSDDLAGCDVERLIVDEKRKRPRRSKKKHARQDAGEAQVSQPSPTGVQQAGDGAEPTAANQVEGGGDEGGEDEESAAAVLGEHETRAQQVQ